MTRRGGLLTAATAVTLLLTAWVSSAGPIGVFARPDLSEFQAPAPGEDYGTPQVSGAGQREIGRTTDVSPNNQALVQVIDWAMKALVVLVVLGVMVAVTRVLVERWQSHEQRARTRSRRGTRCPRHSCARPAPVRSC